MPIFFLIVVPVVLVGNKIDVRKDMYARLDLLRAPLDPVEGVQMARKIGAVAYLECSARYNDGIKEVFETAFRAIFPIKRRMSKSFLRKLSMFK